MRKIAETIQNGKTFLLCMHVDPDGDTAGSASAVASILAKLGKKAFIYSKSLVPSIYMFMKHLDKTLPVLAEDARFDAVIALDCGDIKRIAGWENVRKWSDMLINIDHHADNKKFGDINYTKKSSSTGELVYSLAHELKVEIDADIATSIYCAMITDTGCFKYGNTTSKVFKIASDLVKHGADPFDIANKVYESKTKSEIKILGRALEKIESAMEGKIAWIMITKQDINEAGASFDEMNSIIDHLRSLKDVEIAFLLREVEEGRVKVNFRSKAKNIQRIAREFGGGGHSKASGAVIEGNIQQVKDRVLEKINSLWTEL